MLYLRNNDNVGRRVKVLPPNSPFFTVAKLPPKRGSKEAAAASGATIAPGIEVAYVVRFQPTSPDDASCDLVICTEREKFVVPVRALGRQPALDVPDVIEFETVPCKSEVRRTFQVANIGQQPAHFAMHTSPSFSVTPSEGQLSPGESLQCTVTFCPEDAGEVRGDLEVVYDSGHTTTTQLIGNGREVEVEVSAESVDLLPTYMNKESQKSFKIFNRSDTVVRFSMRQHPTPSDDSQSTANRIADMYATHARTLSAEASLPAALLAGTDEGGAGADGDGNRWAPWRRCALQRPQPAARSRTTSQSALLTICQSARPTSRARRSRHPSAMSCLPPLCCLMMPPPSRTTAARTRRSTSSHRSWCSRRGRSSRSGGSFSRRNRSSGRRTSRLPRWRAPSGRGARWR